MLIWEIQSKFGNLNIPSKFMAPNAWHSRGRHTKQPIKPIFFFPSSLIFTETEKQVQNNLFSQDSEAFKHLDSLIDEHFCGEKWGVLLKFLDNTFSLISQGSAQFRRSEKEKENCFCVEPAPLARRYSEDRFGWQILHIGISNSNFGIWSKFFSLKGIDDRRVCFHVPFQGPRSWFNITYRAVGGRPVNRLTGRVLIWLFWRYLNTSTTPTCAYLYGKK